MLNNDYCEYVSQDLKVLNHEGSVADCASVAGLAALAHFKRSDVTLQGDVIQVSF
jgi:exosome complex RNA-binding protein Rrp42 (RNase PH superfamily)